MGQACTIIEDIAGLKSTATLLKRLGAMRKFMTWSSAQKLAALPFRESYLYAYVRHLWDSQAASTSAQSFVEAVRFSWALFGIDGEPISKRVSGAAAKLAARSGPIKQAPPLSVEQVKELEFAVVHAESCQDRLLAGSLLVLLYARCRFGDGQRATSLIVDLAGASSSTGFVELAVRAYKTATSARKKRQILPVVAPIFSLSGLAWFDAWMAARAGLGLPKEGSLSAPLLPCFDGHGLPTALGLSSSEGGAVWDAETRTLPA